MMTATLPDQKIMSFHLAHHEGESKSARRARIKAAFVAMRCLAHNMGGRLTEGRHKREADGTGFVDFVFVKRRR